MKGYAQSLRVPNETYKDLLSKAKKRPLTPRRKTEEMLRRAGIPKVQADKIRRNLMLSNVIIEQIKDKRKRKDKDVQTMLYGTVAGNIVTQYRCASQISKAAAKEDGLRTPLFIVMVTVAMSLSTKVRHSFVIV
jgi:hypothetical protein